MGWKDAPEVQAAPAWASAPEVNQPSMGRRALQQAGNLAAGAVRGAGSIGATLLAPVDAAARAVGIQNDYIGRTDRRQAMDQALGGMGADTDSLAYKGGKLGAEIAGTAGVGGAVANVLARPLAAAPNLLQAIRTAGMSAGSATGSANALLRAAGGAVNGGASAALVAPEDAGTGAVVGAALPSVVRGVGAVGGAAAGIFKSSQRRAAERVAAALEADPAMAAAQLNGAVVMVPGSNPTVAQVLRTPQAGILERVVSDSPGGAPLKTRYAEQNAARLAALDSVAPIDPRGFRSAQQDFGAAALDATRRGDATAKSATNAAYDAVPLDDASIYLPELAPIRDKFFPSGAFGGRQAVDDAVRVADQIGMVDLQAIKPTRMPADQGPSLAKSVRGWGGLSLSRNDGLGGELRSLTGDVKNLVRRDGGLSPDRMAQTAHEAGLIPEATADSLFEALRAEARGTRTIYQPGGNEQAWRAAAERAMGDAPEAQRVPQRVSLRSVDALRKSIGQAQRAASKDPERATEALALGKMREAIDGRIDEVVRGDGAIDETLPIEWANALTDAQRLKRTQVEKFRTGPQAAAFDRGVDGLPKLQGGEFAPKVWGNRPGIADDIKQFRQVMDEKPALLGKFRSMVTTEGAGTATAGGELSSKFVRWVDNALPGLKAGFETDQVKALQRIAADIKRANAGASAGMSRGSNTYQNAANALSLGLLDSPLLNTAANRVPMVNALTGPGLQWMRESAREKMARELSSLLADPAQAANALLRLSRPQSQNPLIAASLARVAPVLPADQR